MIDEILTRYDRIYPIRIDLAGAGFGAMLLITMNQLRFSERNNLYPVVAFDAACQNAFFDKNYGNNMWHQYFEPVMPLSSESLQSLKITDTEKLFTQTSQAAIEVSETDPDSIYPYPFGKWRFEEIKDLDGWYALQRKKGRETIARYIKPKAAITTQVNAFYDKNLKGSFVLGVHIRGTDLHYAPPVSPAEYFEPIGEYLVKHPDLKILLATDQKQYIEIFKQKFGNKVYFTNSFRSDNEIAPFNRTELSSYQKGEDVLLDILLLAKSDFLIKGASNVGEMAMYFNNKLQCLDLAYKKTKAYGQRYDKGWDNMTNQPAWKLVSKKGLKEIAKDAFLQNKLQEIMYELRKLTKRVRVGLGRVKNLFK